MKLFIQTFILIVFCKTSILSQQLFFRDIYKGGIYSYTVGNSYSGGESTALYPINIPNNSRIKKTFLFVSEDKIANSNDSIILEINNVNYVVSDYYISQSFFSFLTTSSTNDISYSQSHISCIDLTNVPYQNNSYEITVNEHNPYSIRGVSLTLIIIYENSSFPIISSSIFVNNQDVSSSTTFQLNDLPPINNTNPISLSATTTFLCNTNFDGSRIYVNNNLLGLIGGEEINTIYPYCSGVYGCFNHYNNIIYGLAGDTPDSLMENTDVLADIKSYVNYGDTSLKIEFKYQTPYINISRPLTNPIRYISLAYSTKCDTLKSYLTTSDTIICAGESLVLQVGGLEQYSYAWRYRGEVVSTDTALSITPAHNRLYSILVSDTNGCSKTEIINVKVNPKPRFATTVSNATCPNNNGSIVLDSMQGVAPPFRFKKDNGNWQTAPVYGYLPLGNYNISLRDTNGCIATQNVTVESINNSIADFSFANPLPFVPTEVVFENQSQNTSEYQWLINGVNADNTENLAYLFQQEGNYEITLIASQPNGLCIDTITKTITLNSKNYFYVPTTINGEIVVFSNGYQSVNFSLVNALGQQIFSKNTTITNSEHLILNHKKIAKGIYFYQAEAVKDNGEIVVFSGKVLF